MAQTLYIRALGLQSYLPIWQNMQHFTEQRTGNTIDELWLLEHEPVFTMGRNALKEHILSATDIPIIPIDRGGQVTYHGPGQLVIYLLIDLKRLGLGVRQFITIIEQSIINTLSDYQVNACAKKEAPGVYINNAKIAALGLRIKKGCSFHGLSLNFAMNLQPFKLINPCGYKGLEVIQLSDYINDVSLMQVQDKLAAHLANKLGYTEILWQKGLKEKDYA